MEKFGLKLGVSIAEMLCCNPLFGLIALILIVVANSKFKAGDEEGATKLAKANTILLIVGAVLAVIGGIVYFAIFGAAMMASSGSAY